MLLEKVYTDFVNHTNLTDSVYKSVFVNISDMLGKIGDIHWQYLKYSDSEGDPSVFDLIKRDKVPRYVVELFQNVFVNYYTLPDKTTVELALTYKGIPMKIMSSSDVTEIPSEVTFLKSHNLYNTFILNKLVYDLFGAFEVEFSFMDAFKTGIQDIFQPLKNKLDKGEARYQVVENKISVNTVAESQLIVEGLRNKIKDVLDRIENIRKTRDQLTINRNIIFGGINSRDSLLLEQDKLNIEYGTLNEIKLDYIKKSERIVAVLKTIDLELSDNLVKKGDSPIDVDYLTLKKATFERDKLSFDKSIIDFSKFLDDMTARKKYLLEELTKIEEYTTNDVDSIDSQIKSVNAEQENLYGILLGLESELKHQNNILGERAVQVETAATAYSDITIQNIENTAIVHHLTASLQPSSVTTVINYLRYYFSYNATLLANELIKSNPEMEVSRAQAVAVKLTLVRCFGVYFNQLFSAVDFADSRIGKVIVINK